MGEWLQSLAVGLAVLAGLVNPAPGLKLDAAALQTPQAVLVEASVAGAATAQVREYLLAGNALTLTWEFRWGDTVLVRERTIAYHAWDAVFEVADGGELVLMTTDEAQALAAWATLPTATLGSRAALEARLGSPLQARASLGKLASLWAYQSLEASLLYRTWTELPR